MYDDNEIILLVLFTHSSRRFTWFRRRGFKRGGEHNVLWKH